jgi:hypothetical protein
MQSRLILRAGLVELFVEDVPAGGLKLPMSVA